MFPISYVAFDAVAGDWESGAIAYVASRRNTRLLIVRAVSDLVNTQGDEAIGNLTLFQNEAARIMRSLLDDLATLVPYIRTRCHSRTFWLPRTKRVLSNADLASQWT